MSGFLGSLVIRELCSITVYFTADGRCPYNHKLARLCVLGVFNLLVHVLYFTNTAVGFATDESMLYLFRQICSCAAPF